MVLNEHIAEYVGTNPNLIGSRAYYYDHPDPDKIRIRFFDESQQDVGNSEGWHKFPRSEGKPLDIDN